MDFNIFIIFFIFIILSILIYYTYSYNNNNYNNNNTKISEPFFSNNTNINTNLNNYNIKKIEGFVDETIPTKNNFNYLKTSIPLKYDTQKPGDEIISNYKQLNNKNNFDDIDKIFDNCNSNQFDIYNKEFYDKHFIKNKSTDLPIANIHTNFLLNNNFTKLSDFNNNFCT